jgi:hypothetical protein
MAQNLDSSRPQQFAARMFAANTMQVDGSAEGCPGSAQT